MKALVLEKYIHLVYKNVAAPELTDNEVLVKEKRWEIGLLLMHNRY